MRYLVLIVVLLCGLSADVMCQSPPEETEASPVPPTRPVAPEPPKKIFIRRNVWVAEYRFTAKERRLLEPTAEDHDLWSSFLRLPDTADLLVAFRAVRMDVDGSVTIAWRKLKAYPNPEWKRREP